ncbi:protein kinase domain-containing protein [Roseisolibacter agri]|uniref:non-specific serine/threonine protein kinase n=1 Tax=Roseisolibacter agri TaxID=2014610 RepID=A0AA37QCG0_9BACT|nr:protein kinase [Roseisolibacter agri]GLC27737.1 hypothetical protein rosag_42500 [Roseisolibacter agri]
MADQLRTARAPFGDAADVAELSNEYELLGELGRGGSAVVYRAQDRSLGREVAIKVVHPRAAAPGDDPVARLAREARTVAQLQHPNIVTVFAVRRLRSGGLALVMQMVPGNTLKAIIQRDGPLAPERAERILRDVAQALAYAHARGVVHRDVKPENIFLDEESGRALLSDFGIARSDEHDSMTMTGTALGTPFYMSPEQVEGGTLDGRSDLYSLGLVAWEMLTGRRPWDGESLYNVIYKQKHEELPPIEALRPGVPTRLQYLVERMLQKRPAARWAGAEGLLAQLSHAVLPSDYGRWQSSLRPRVERWREQERERAKQVADGRQQESPGATLRFPRRVRAGAAVGATLDDGTVKLSRETGEADTAALIVGPDGKVTVAGVPADLRAHDALIDASTGQLALDVSEPLIAPELLAEPEAVRYDDVAEPNWEHAPVPARTGSRRVLLGVGALVASLGIVAAGYGNRERIVGALGDASPAPTEVAGVPASVDAPSAVNAEAVEATTSAPSAGAFPIGGSADVVTAGGRHSCVVTFGALLYCWGANDRGQLGDAGTASRTSPTRVAADLQFVQVSAGTSHTCAVTPGGDAYCWGDDANGQLGDGTRVRRTAPVRLAGSERFAFVLAGGTVSCGLTTRGGVSCWGANDHGQLGDDSTIPSRTAPAEIRWPSGGRVQGIAVGASHACALDADGRAFCWGANDRGQLGDGTTTDRRTPTRVAGDARFIALSAGRAHTCAATTERQVLCWGENRDGQLGARDQRQSSTVPTSVALPAGAMAIAVTAGGAHSCALGSTGGAWCWGRNASGQLGRGSTRARGVPAPVRAPSPLAAIAAAAAHTCALTTAGEALCWGAAGDGQLGDDARTARREPTMVALSPQLVSRPLRTR